MNSELKMDLTVYHVVLHGLSHFSRGGSTELW